MSKKKNKKHLSLPADKRPLFAPWNDIYLTSVDKANSRKALREAMREELYDYYDELEDLEHEIDC